MDDDFEIVNHIHCFYAVMIIVFFIVEIWLLSRLWRTYQMRKEPLPTPIREISHSISNEATALRGGIRQLEVLLSLRGRGSDLGITGRPHEKQ